MNRYQKDKLKSLSKEEKEEYVRNQILTEKLSELRYRALKEYRELKLFALTIVEL